MKVVDLKPLAKERGLRGYYKLRKAELITFIQNNLRPSLASRPIHAERSCPRHPTRPPPLIRNSDDMESKRYECLSDPANDIKVSKQTLTYAYKNKRSLTGY